MAESLSQKTGAIREITFLDDIARESFRGRYINSRLGNWFANNNTLLEGGRLRDTDITAIGNLLGDIKSGLDETDPESKKLAEEIDHWRIKGVVPGRKLILKMKGDTDEPTISEKFAEILKREAEFFENYQDNKKHLLTILDDILKSADAKEDEIYIHLAGAAIYFLKMNGYKVGPFVKRLKEIEESKLGNKHAD
jgi:hypothetical protein